MLTAFLWCYSQLLGRLTMFLLYMILNEWLSFYSKLLNIHRSGVLTALFGCCLACAMWNYCRLSTYVYSIQPCTSLQCHFITSHILWVHVFWHNLPPALLAEWPGYLLHAAAVMQGWSGYQNETCISTCLSSWRRWCWRWCCDPGSCGPPPAAPGRCWCLACHPSAGKLPPGPCPQTPAEQRTAEIQEHSLLLCGYIWALHCTGAACSKMLTNPNPYHHQVVCFFKFNVTLHPQRP